MRANLERKITCGYIYIPQIYPRHMLLAICNDKELGGLHAGGSIAHDILLSPRVAAQEDSKEDVAAIRRLGSPPPPTPQRRLSACTQIVRSDVQRRSAEGYVSEGINRIKTTLPLTPKIQNLFHVCTMLQANGSIAIFVLLQQ
jgi:hypothetical protein